MRSVAPLNPQLQKPERAGLREAFLKHQAKAMLALPSDASKRQYFRYDGGLLMDAPPPEDPSQFMRVSSFLRSLGFSAPQILDHNLGHGFLALEDFGDTTYTRLLQEGENPYPLYDLAVDTLIALHQRAHRRPDFIEPYSVELLLGEVELFVDWYIPQQFGRALSKTDKQEYLDLWGKVFEKALMIPHSLVLRDYHVDNLMCLKNRPGIAACGLLDFQDALWGPVVYDLVSLTEDARLDLEPSLIEHCWQRYLGAFPEADQSHMRIAGDILSAGRHAKIIGIFTRLSVRDGKEKYLEHIPRVKRLLKNCLAKPCLEQLRVWFEKNLGEWRE